MEWRLFEKYMPITETNADYVRSLAAYCRTSGHRPEFHMTPPCGLMNDPNGLAYYNGNYHIFYQWYPFGPSHGMKHWGHYVSEDFTSFDHSEEILIPTEEYEKNGCYSGNAIKNGENLYLYYTANYKTDDGKVPKQAVAFLKPDGKIYKYKKNPIIDETPEGMTGEIRDPFVFFRDECYYMMLGGKSKKGQGELLFYKSIDGLQWEYKGTIAVEKMKRCSMVECPSIIRIGDKDVLFLSLIGCEPEGDRYRNEFSSIYWIGHLDIENLCFYTESCGELDKGFDFYAPQSFYDKDGKPIFLAWFGCGTQKVPYMEEEKWVHGLTMPRKLSIREDRLIQSPYEKMAFQYDTYVVQKGSMYSSDNSFCLKLERDTEDIRCIRIGEEFDNFQIIIDREKGRLTVDRSRLEMNFCQEYGETRSLSFSAGEGICLDLYYDNTFAELFVNDGEEVMTFRAFPPSLKITAE